MQLKIGERYKVKLYGEFPKEGTFLGLVKSHSSYGELIDESRVFKDEAGKVWDDKGRITEWVCSL